ncbi:putative reverse transcriptase domain-containing protein [Tanacetum coccineum]
MSQDLNPYTGGRDIKADIATFMFSSFPFMKKTDSIGEAHANLLEDTGALGMEFGYTYAFHPQMDGQSERTIQMLEDMLRACVIDFGRRKSYADRRTKLLEFEVGDMIMLKVSPWKGVVRFGKHRKLSPRYIRPFKILARVGRVAYTLELPKELKGIHSTFHVSNLKRCLLEGDIVFLMDEIQLDDKLHMIEKLVEVVDREIKQLEQSRGVRKAKVFHVVDLIDLDLLLKVPKDEGRWRGWSTYLIFARKCILRCKYIVNDYSWEFSFHRSKVVKIVLAIVGTDTPYLP